MQEAKKPTIEDQNDPLQWNASPSLPKKTQKVNALEKAIQEQEKNLLEHKANPAAAINFAVNESMFESRIPKKFQPDMMPRYPFGTSPEKNTSPQRQNPAPPKQESATWKNPFNKDQVPQADTPSSESPQPHHRHAKSGSSPKVTIENLTTPADLASSDEEQEEREDDFRPLRPRGVPVKNEDFGLIIKEILPGEKVAISLRCVLTPMQYPSLSIEGLFILTNYKVIFKPKQEKFFRKENIKPNYLEIPLGFISRFEKTKNMDTALVDIHSKDGRSFRLTIPDRNTNEIHTLLQYLNTLAFPDKKEHFFAFAFGKANKVIEEEYKGWKIYNIEREFQRQGLEFDTLEAQIAEKGTKHLYRLVDNSNGQFCQTYPPRLMVPANMTDKALLAASKFRTKHRLPTVTYYYKATKTILARSSQSKPGIYASRSAEDEALLRLLGDPTDFGDGDPAKVNLIIYDARPYINAMAMKMNGAGFEDIKVYKNCEIFFMDIANIHNVREGYKKILALCANPELASQKWYSQLESTNWLSVISYILTAATKAAASLKKGKNCLIHCSDGWDRTAQICSLTQILLDPYFRTIEGFGVLIQKEWVYYGYQFSTRGGHGSRNEKDEQRSPVFLQFLDCVHQLMHQYPFAFEFNDRLLCDLAFHSHSCQFGTFLCNCYQEMKLFKIEDETVSIWSFINSRKEKYCNVFYKEPNPDHPFKLNPSNHMKHLRLWEEHFLYFSWLAKPNFSIADNINFHKDFYEYMLKKQMKNIKNLQSENEELRARLSKYEQSAQASSPEQRKNRETIFTESQISEEKNVDISSGKKEALLLAENGQENAQKTAEDVQKNLSEDNKYDLLE